MGLGLVDGTSPHVVEPVLCGCGANYLNLGIYYREAALSAIAPALRKEKAANRACYGPAYGCLAAAAAVSAVIRQLAEPVKPKHLTELALPQLPQPSTSGVKNTGAIRRCFLSGITPNGLLRLNADCESLWCIRDSFGLGSGLIQRLADQWHACGADIVLAMDPMDPETPSGLFVPSEELGFLRTDPAFGDDSALLCLDLDQAVAAAVSSDVCDRACQLLRQRKQLMREAVHWLEEAKRHHDRLEELYRPSVDFDGLNEEAEELIEGMLEEV